MVKHIDLNLSNKPSEIFTFANCISWGLCSIGLLGCKRAEFDIKLELVSLYYTPNSWFCIGSLYFLEISLPKDMSL
uniref:Uncharacterized protein n=1 Tax=Arundo donax TaxID=35708 RepID=A0A0A8XWN9_ARUDO